MNKQLSATELGLLSSVAPHVMTRREKLLRFAMIVRTSQRNFVIFHHLEYMTEPQLRDAYHPESAFAAAAADPILSDAGLASGRVGEAQRFFELSKNDLHEFSCDCGGVIRNHPVNTTAAVCRSFMLGLSISRQPLSRARLADVHAGRLD